MSKQPLKVLSICTSLGGGAGRAAYRIHQSVRRLGVESRMFLKGGVGDAPDIISLQRFVPHNQLYKAFDWTRNKLENKIQHYRWSRYPERELFFMSDLRGTDLNGALKKLDFDVLHLHWINNRFVHLKDLPRNKPIVWTLHDSWPFCGVCHYFMGCEGYKKHCGRCPLLHSNKIEDLSYRVWQEKTGYYQKLNLHIVTPSRWLGDCAGQSSLLSRFPVEVIPNCLDVETFRPLNDTELSPRWRQFQEKRFEKSFILFGAMNAATDKRKGYANLVSALRLLELWGYGNSWELIVFGAKESELSTSFHFPVHYVGYVDNTKELVSLYNLASVMVVPSLAENLSCAILESLSCGTPVVSFDIGGNGDLIEHQKNGYLAREQDNEDLARGIMWCLERNADKHLSKAARIKVLKDNTLEVVGRRYKNLYEQLVEKANE